MYSTLLLRPEGMAKLSKTEHWSGELGARKQAVGEKPRGETSR